MVIKKKPANDRLFAAITARDLVAAKQAIRAGADVDATIPFDDSSHTTLLHCAALTEDTKILQLLIDNGADINAKGPEQTTPLHWAAAANQLKAAKLLIDWGADANAFDTWNETPSQYAANRCYRDLAEMLETAAAKIQNSHAGRVTDERKDKGPPQFGG